MAVANNLFRIGAGEGSGVIAAAIFWLKTRPVWREVARGAEVAADTCPKISFVLGPNVPSGAGYGARIDYRLELRGCSGFTFPGTSFQEWCGVRHIFH
jgi:hypothetical protein